MQQYNQDPFVLITTRNASKGIKNLFNAVDEQGLANNYDRYIKGRTNFNTFVMLKY